VTLDRIIVPAAIALGIGAGTILPVMRAMAKTGGSGLTFHQRRRDFGERVTGGVVGALGVFHAGWGVGYAALGPVPLGVHLGPPWLFWSGFGTYLAGVAFVALSQSTMGRSWRIGVDQKRTSLVTGGVYSYVRNPIYVGVIVLGFATLMMTPSIIGAVGALGYWIAIQVQVRYEERLLLDVHGDDYRRFCDRVGRFVPRARRTLSASERALLKSVAEAVVPAGAVMPGAGEDTVRELEARLDEATTSVAHMLRLTLFGIRVATLGRFTSMTREQRTARYERWLSTAPGLARGLLRALVAVVKSAHLERPETAKAIGARQYAPIAPEQPRWLSQLKSGESLEKDEQLEVDAVVVGTGAGGAVAAYELASRGHAVLMVEEGRWFGRHEFTGPPAPTSRKMFRDGGLTFAIGNVFAPVWVGVTVGGTTTVNSGTCYRTPEAIFERWRKELGLEMFSSASMTPYFERVEQALGVAPTSEAQLTGNARAVARGAAKLGLAAHPIHRNAPGCDGQGRCIYGCPTAAKRSTDVSYVPMALEKGAQLYAQTKAVELLRGDGGRVTGLVARTASGARITVKAKATVLAGGALMTPLLLLQEQLGGAMVGRNLSLHPAGPVLAELDEAANMEQGVPQGLAIEALASEGIMIEESGNPPEVIGVALPLVGERFSRLIERHAHLAAFGYMIGDTSRGQVRRGAHGALSISYSLNDEDVKRMHRALVTVSELFLASGAKTVFPAVRGLDALTDAAGLERLKAMTLGAGDFAMSAVHPLGTARLGADPAVSVVGADHQVHGVPGLYVIDGSSVPTALGVNPQITIMAMAARAGELLAARL
jgi:choline dehydrogenase-like flavoprotein/protein-S-isoprenylcysteine O-methyltransferase Ste14